MDDIHVQKVASSIWKLEISKSNEGADPESVARALTGANAILRMVSGVFPQTYRPLINFLSALTVHEDSAQEVLSFLCERLITISESSLAYQPALQVIDEGERVVLSSICDGTL